VDGGAISAWKCDHLKKIPNYQILAWLKPSFPAAITADPGNFLLEQNCLRVCSAPSALPVEEAWLWETAHEYR